MKEYREFLRSLPDERKRELLASDKWWFPLGETRLDESMTYEQYRAVLSESLKDAS